jgi:RNA polymerase sigma-70 factor (ECF subfamily)
MATHDPDLEQLLERAAQGDQAARGQLLTHYQARLRQLIALRLDRRLAARIDPSDVLQEALAEAVAKLPDYLRDRPLPFYPWLRQLTLDRLVELYRQHVRTRRRSVTREERRAPPLSDESLLELAGRLLAPGSSPSARLRREELCDRVRAALAQLSEPDRELLVLRHLEQLSGREIAAVLGLTEGAVYTRHLRALKRLREILGEEGEE